MSLIDPSASWNGLGATDQILFPLLSVVILILSGTCSGLTIGMFSIDVVDMRIMANTGDDTERKRASRLLPLLERANLTLVTLLVANTLAVTTLPLVLDAMFGEFLALLFSVTLLLFFGEILPQATFVRYNFVICSALVPFVYFCMVVTFPLSYPLSILLDRTIGSEDTSITRDTLHSAVERIYGTADWGEDGIAIQEIKVMQGAMMLPKKAVKDLHYVKYDDAFMLNGMDALTPDLIDTILKQGYSRVPVFLGSRQQIVGVLIVKSLLSLAFTPQPQRRVIDIPLREPLRVPLNGKLLDVYRAFRRGNSQLAAVYGQTGTLEGFVSLEDIFTMIQQQEIADELDIVDYEEPTETRPYDLQVRRSLKAARQHHILELYDSVATNRQSQRQTFH